MNPAIMSPRVQVYQAKMNLGSIHFCVIKVSKNQKAPKSFVDILHALEFSNITLCNVKN